MKILIPFTFAASIASFTMGAGVAYAERPPVQPVASTQENNASLDNFSKITGAAATGGGLAGTAAGAVIGCIIGLPAGIVGCIPAAVTGAGIGGVVGTLVVGGPAGIATAVDVVQTYLAEPGTTHWAVK